MAILGIVQPKLQGVDSTTGQFGGYRPRQKGNKGTLTAMLLQGSRLIHMSYWLDDVVYIRIRKK